MSFEFSQVNWLSVFVCFVIGQVFLTLWFTVLFGEPWAKAYNPSMSKAEHTKEVPGFTNSTTVSKLPKYPLTCDKDFQLGLNYCQAYPNNKEYHLKLNTNENNHYL